MISIRTSKDFNIIFHYPETEEGRKELADKAAIIHADACLNKINSLPISTRQKIALIDALIDETEANMAKKKRSMDMER